MFLIFKFLPDWLWLLTAAAPILGFFASRLPILKTYSLIIKIVSLVTLVSTIFILGMLYADNTWKAAAKELENKVAIAEAQAKVVNTTIETKVITKTQVVKIRGDDIIKYVDREVTKYDNTCIIPKEFITSHNRAAEQPK